MDCRKDILSWLDNNRRFCQNDELIFDSAEIGQNLPFFLILTFYPYFCSPNITVYEEIVISPYSPSSVLPLFLQVEKEFDGFYSATGVAD